MCLPLLFSVGEKGASGGLGGVYVYVSARMSRDYLQHSRFENGMLVVGGWSKEVKG